MLTAANISVKANVMSRVVIDGMRPGEWERVKGIYLEGIATGQATFETDAPSWEQWDASHLLFARLVARKASEVLGWAGLSRVSQRQSIRRRRRDERLCQPVCARQRNRACAARGFDP